MPSHFCCHRVLSHKTFVFNSRHKQHKQCVVNCFCFEFWYALFAHATRDKVKSGTLITPDRVSPNWSSDFSVSVASHQARFSKRSMKTSLFTARERSWHLHMACGWLLGKLRSRCDVAKRILRLAIDFHDQILRVPLHISLLNQSNHTQVFIIC